MMAMVNGRVSFGFGALAGALLLGGIVFLAAPPAQAGEPTEEIAAAAACLVFELITEVTAETCDEWECNPDESDCERACRETARGCNRTSRSGVGTLWLGVRMTANASKLACAAVEDAEAKRECKNDIIDGKRAIRDELQIAREVVRDVCNSEILNHDCLDVCDSIIDGIECEI